MAGTVGSETVGHTHLVPKGLALATQLLLEDVWMICSFTWRMTFITGVKTNTSRTHVTVMTTRTESSRIVGETRTPWDTLGGNDSGWMFLSSRHSYNILLCVEHARCRGVIFTLLFVFEQI